jgi:hypothetical protein
MGCFGAHYLTAGNIMPVNQDHPPEKGLVMTLPEIRKLEATASELDLGLIAGDMLSCMQAPECTDASDSPLG